MTLPLPLPAARVRRQSAAVRYAFAPIGDDGEALAPDLCAEAYARGRRDGAAEAALDAAARDAAETDALRAEVERLTEALAAAESRAASAVAESAAEAEAARALGAETAARLTAAWDAGLRALEPPLAALAVAVAEGVLDAPLSELQQQAAAAALAEAVDAVAGAAPTTVALHPVDLLRLQEGGLADAVAAAHPALRWESDATLAPGDWAVETPEAAVHHLRGPLLASLRERLGLPAFA